MGKKLSTVGMMGRALARQIGITKVDIKMQQRIIKAMNKTWQAIGSDALEAVADELGQDGLSREEVIELVIDAGRVGAFGNDKEAAEALYKLTYDEMVAIGRKAFPFKTYS